MLEKLFFKRAPFTLLLPKTSLSKTIAKMSPLIEFKLFELMFYPKAVELIAWNISY